MTEKTAEHHVYEFKRTQLRNRLTILNRQLGKLTKEIYAVQAERDRLKEKRPEVKRPPEVPFLDMKTGRRIESEV